MISVKNYKNPYLAQKPVPFPGETYENAICVNHKGNFIKYAAAGGRLILGIGLILLAPDFAFANTGIDAEAKNLYFGEFIGIAKWIIIVKGGWDTVHKMLKEDFDGAKKSFLQYLIVFAILLGLPTALDKIQDIFRRLG